MLIQHINPTTLFPSARHGFSQVVVAAGEKMAFISGQTAWNVDKQVVGRTLGEQTAAALRNLRYAIEAAGGTFDNIVAIRIYIVGTEMANVGAVGQALREAFPGDPPASTWLGVTALAVPDFLVEIEATAVLD